MNWFWFQDVDHLIGVIYLLFIVNHIESMRDSVVSVINENINDIRMKIGLILGWHKKRICVHYRANQIEVRRNVFLLNKKELVFKRTDPQTKNVTRTNAYLTSAVNLHKVAPDTLY